MYPRGKNIHTRYETNGKSAIRHIAKRNTVIVTTTAPILEIILFIIFPPQLAIFLILQTWSCYIGVVISIWLPSESTNSATQFLPILVNGKQISTLYAHLDSVSVSNGAYVSKGQVVGREGTTGYSTGPHCHFEVRVNGKPNNPLNYI